MSLPNTKRAAFTVDGAPFDYRGGPTNWREHCRDVAATHFGAARLRHLECEVKIGARFYVKCCRGNSSGATWTR